MNIIVNADDFANSPNMSDIICRCFDEGALNSTSIMINSPQLDYSLEKLSQRPELRKSLHLNIAEGKPVSNPADVMYLIDSNNLFCKSFETILFEYYFGTSSKREQIKKHIKEEYKNQILLYAKKLNIQSINIDSHQHYHTIPFIADILIALQKELNIKFTYIRTPSEPFFIDLSSFGNLKNYLGLNLIKHLLLNFLSHSLKKKLSKNNISHSDLFVGVLFTGNMTFNSIKKALGLRTNAQTVEILLHPAYLSKTEAHSWDESKFKNFYIDPNREKEMDVLLLGEFQAYLKTLQKEAHEKQH